ncbi:MAG: hypothetical protein L0Y56_19335 [Nitrospira sp.]|nr:hypothetical protein [Nitrospira sp.]
MQIDKAYLEFAKSRLGGYREMIRTAAVFQCACCLIEKDRNEAAGVHMFKPEDPALWKAMEVAPNQHRVGLYALCLECMDSVPEEIRNQKVLSYLGSQGLFGEKKVS